MKLLIGFITLLVALVVVALFAGEVLVRPAAQNEIGGYLKDRYHLARTPGVRIHGFPFLWRAVQGHFSSVDITLDDYNAEGLNVKSFTLHLDDVRFRPAALVMGERKATADRGTGEAHVRDTDLSEYLQGHGVPLTVRFAAGLVTVSGRVDVAGVGTDVASTGRLTFSDGALHFTPQAARAGSLELSGDVFAGIVGRFSFDVPVPEIVGVHVTALVLRLNEAVLTADVTEYLIAKQGQALPVATVPA